MTAYLFRCLGLAGSQMTDQPIPAGLYLVSYDPDGNDGYGDAEFTNDPDKAHQFTSPTEAFALWRAVSTVRPLREDGEPNRPLTAYHMECLNLNQVRKEADR